MKRALALVATLAAVAGACASPSTGPPSAAALLPDLASLTGGGQPGAPLPDDPPADLLVQKAPTKQADRLLQKSQQKADYCEVVYNVENLEEPRPDDLEAIAEYAALYIQFTGALKPDSRVINPDDREKRIELPAPMVELVQTVKKEMYAYSVRVAYTKALADRDLIDGDEVRRRLDRAFVLLYQSSYTDAERELVALRPRYCGR